MRLAIVVSLLLFGSAFAQNTQFSSKVCADGQMISQRARAVKQELKFTSSSRSIAKCFYSINSQMKASGWKMIRSDNNLYQNNLYRITYKQGDEQQTLILLKYKGSYKVIVGL